MAEQQVSGWPEPTCAADADCRLLCHCGEYVDSHNDTFDHPPVSMHDVYCKPAAPARDKEST